MKGQVEPIALWDTGFKHSVLGLYSAHYGKYSGCIPQVFSVYQHSKHILLGLYFAHCISSCDSLYNLSGILEHEAKIDVWKQD